MVEVIAQAEFPGFKMKIRTHQFTLSKTLTDEVLEHVMQMDLEAWDSYNLFDTDVDCIRQLAKKLHYEAGQFNRYGEIRNDLWINGWVNLLHKNDSIKPHFHSAEKNSYYSCNISLDNYTSKTLFYPPWGDRHGHIIEQENIKGRGMFFPQWLWHEVPPIEDEIRYTLGIDIHTDEMMENHDTTAPITRSIKLNEVYT